MKIFALALTLAFGPAPPPDGSVTEEPDAFVLGSSAFASGDYDAAAAQFEIAYAEEPLTPTLYNWAQALRLSGRCEAAAAVYERFVTQGSATPQGGIAVEAWTAMRAHAAEQVEACPPEVAASPPEPVAAVLPEPVADAPSRAPDSSKPQPSVETPEARARPDDPSPERDGLRRRRPDALGVSLLATGSALTAVGIGLFVGAELVARDAETQFIHQDQRDGLRRAASVQLAGAVVLPVGAALAIGGAVRLGVVARRRRAVALSLHPSARGIVLSGRF